MPASMTREERNVLPRETADNVRIRRRAPRRLDRALFLRFNSRHGVKSAAANNSDSWFHA